MKSKILVLLMLFAVMGTATYWFYTKSAITSEQIAANKPDIKKNAVKQSTVAVSATGTDSAEANNEQGQQNTASAESLFDLKSSIQDVITDSVQDEIQSAVENKIIKTNDVQQ